MNVQAIQQFLATTAMSWQQPRGVPPAHCGAEGKASHSLHSALDAWRERRDAANGGKVCRAPALRPGIRLNFELMRQARVVPRGRDANGNTVDLRIGEHTVRVRLDTHEVISVI